MDRLFTFKNTIDDTPRVVARDFVKKYRSSTPISNVIADDGIKVKENLPPVAKKVTNAELQKNPVLQKPGKVTKREQAWKLFIEGYGANEVAAHMEITYANSHYYLRALRKAGGNIGQEVK